MSGFELYDGDLVITNGEISMTEGNSLKAQTIMHVLSTNLEEWLFNASEGIAFENILGLRANGREIVSVDENVVRSEIERGIAQVDSTLVIDEFSCEYNKDSRKLSVYFTAKTSDGETLTVNTEY